MDALGYLHVRKPPIGNQIRTIGPPHWRPEESMLHAMKKTHWDKRLVEKKLSMDWWNGKFTRTPYLPFPKSKVSSQVSLWLCAVYIYRITIINDYIYVLTHNYAHMVLSWNGDNFITQKDGFEWNSSGAIRELHLPRHWQGNAEPWAKRGETNWSQHIIHASIRKQRIYQNIKIK